MTPISYLDFDLLIEPVDFIERRYRAHVLNSPRGQATLEFILPFTDIELENYIRKLAGLRRGVRGAGSSEGRTAIEFGSKLYHSIFTGEVGETLRRSLDVIDDYHGLRIRLHQGERGILANLPWEYLYDPTFRRFFGCSVNTPIVRYLQLPQNIKPLAVKPPLNILVLISKPHEYISLDVESEWDNLVQSLADLKSRNLVTLTRIENATISSLRYQLLRKSYHIFHFIGHGSFDMQSQEGVLLFENEAGYAHPVTGDQLGAIFHDHSTLRLTILNTCEGARIARNDPFSGVAQHLVLQGIPAVIAMQFEITDQAAQILAQEFYTLLADGYPVDMALSEARKAIFTASKDIEWGTPVLYLRAQDGYIFGITEAPSVITISGSTLKRSAFHWQPNLILALTTLLVIISLWFAVKIQPMANNVLSATPTITTENRPPTDIAAPTPHSNPSQLFIGSVTQQCTGERNMTWFEGTIYVNNKPANGYKVAYRSYLVPGDTPVTDPVISGPHDGYPDIPTGYYSYIINDYFVKKHLEIWVIGDNDRVLSNRARWDSDGPEGPCNKAIIDFYR